MEVLCRKLIHCKKCIYVRNTVRTFCDKSAAAADGEQWPRHVVTGLQPTGALHAGNYFGAVRRCARLLQQGEDLTVFIADLHSLTTRHDAGALQRHTLELAAYLIASGVEPARCTLFVQSTVPRHAELCWALACAASLARLHHLPQYREKAHALDEAPAGLLLYPVLQAADVLVYRGTHAVVGRDQAQHLQLAAQLARTFRHRYGPAFPAPAPLLPDDGSDRILSLRDPSKKMSKSDTDPKSRVLLSDADDVIERKIRKAVTDFTPQVTYDPAARPGVSNLVTLHCLATDASPEEVVEEADGLTTAQYKAVVARALVACVAPVRERARRLLARPDFLRDVLRYGAVKARARADETYERVARLMGLGVGVVGGSRVAAAVGTAAGSTTAKSAAASNATVKSAAARNAAASNATVKSAAARNAAASNATVKSAAARNAAASNATVKSAAASNASANNASANNASASNATDAAASMAATAGGGAAAGAAARRSGGARAHAAPERQVLQSVAVDK